MNDLADEFLYEHYRDDIGQIVLGDEAQLNVSVDKLQEWDPDTAERALTEYQLLCEDIADASQSVDLPIPPETQKDALTDLSVSLVDFPDDRAFDPLRLMKDNDASGRIALQGDLAKAMVPKERCMSAAFKCVKCGNIERFEPGEEWQKIVDCPGCERKTMAFSEEDSRFEPYSKLRVETPPSERGDLRDEHTDVEVTGDLVWHGSDAGLAGRTGEPVTVVGEVDRYQPNQDKPLFEKRVAADDVQFRSDNVELKPSDYLDDIRKYADRDDRFELWKESLVPELYATSAWDIALELLLTYLFGAPRVDIPDGITIRGDVHVLIISDYGMGKSMVNEAIADFSPSCIKETVTGYSSDVALLAAAVEDDFGDGGWSLEPGILVRGDGGHVILDEIDKTDADLDRMNDALEGKQQVDINKAGQTATFDSRCGLLATGNPEGDRFDAEVSTREQIDIPKSLLSRFDGIVTMRDVPDADVDENIAKTAGQSYVEGLEYQNNDLDEFDTLSRTISKDLGRNWVYYAREHFAPTPTREQIDRVADWYANEARTLNADKQNAPVPVNSRHVHAVLRRAMAYARMSLQDTVSDALIDRAIEIQKTLISQNWDGNAFVPIEFQADSDTEDTSPNTSTKHGRVTALKEIIRDCGTGDGANVETVYEQAEDAGIPRGKAEHEIQNLRDSGDVFEPANGRLEVV